MTDQTLKNPSVVTLPNPVGIDLAIASLQTKLAELTWLEKSFGRAWSIPQNIPGSTAKETVPMVYQGGKEYYPVLANDALKSYSFWRVNGGRNLDEFSPFNNHGVHDFTDPVDLIVWFNQKRVEPTKDYVIKEQLIKDVLNKLGTDPNAYVLRVWDDKAEDIFRGYTIKEAHRDLLMYPFGAFRIEMNLKYQFDCVEATAPTTTTTSSTTTAP